MEAEPGTRGLRAVADTNASAAETTAGVLPARERKALSSHGLGAVLLHSHLNSIRIEALIGSIC